VLGGNRAETRQRDPGRRHLFTETTTNLSCHVDPRVLHSSGMWRSMPMTLEPHDAGAGPGGPPARGDPGAPAPGEGWGWALVQRDWSLRQREPHPARVLAALGRRAAAAVAWLWRRVRWAPRGAMQDSPR
jgi:hypothetical protein